MSRLTVDLLPRVPGGRRRSDEWRRAHTEWVAVLQVKDRVTDMHVLLHKVLGLKKKFDEVHSHFSRVHSHSSLGGDDESEDMLRLTIGGKVRRTTSCMRTYRRIAPCPVRYALLKCKSSVIRSTLAVIITVHHVCS
eukprot:1194464-Prorocentrum_minimum.AAC.5